jgi:hypothetical protein
LALVLSSGPLIAMMSNPVVIATLLGEPPDPSAPFAMFTPLYFGSMAASWIGGAFLHAALTHGAVVQFGGRTPGVGECMAAGLRFFLPIIAIILLNGLGVGFGFVLLIVPGLMLMTAWFVIIPAAVVERVGIFGAFSRSGRLTKGHRWAIFFLVFLMGFANYVVQVFEIQVSRALLEAGLSRFWAVAVPFVLITPFAWVIWIVGVSSIYFELRHIKEGVQADQLAAVFD